MGQRLELQALLEELLGSENVYYQPPSNLVMQYPAIVYKKDDEDVDFANNAPYRRTVRWMVTVIDRDPDSDIPEKVAVLPMCLFSRRYIASGLNHDVYNLYF